MLNLKARFKIERRMNTSELGSAQPAFARMGVSLFGGSCELRPWNMASGKERRRKIHSIVQFMLGREAAWWWSRHRKRCNSGWWNSTAIFSEGLESLIHFPPCLGGSTEAVWLLKVPGLWKRVTRGCFSVCSAGWGWLLQARGTRAASRGIPDDIACQAHACPVLPDPHPSPLAQLWASLGTDGYKSLQRYSAEQGEFQHHQGCQVPPVLTVRSEKEPPPHAKTKNTTDTKIQAFRRNAHELHIVCLALLLMRFKV